MLHKTKDILSLFSYWADRYDAELAQQIAGARALTRAKRPQTMEVTDLQMALLECLTSFKPSDEACRVTLGFGPFPGDSAPMHRERDAWVKAHTGLDPL